MEESEIIIATLKKAPRKVHYVHKMVDTPFILGILFAFLSPLLVFCEDYTDFRCPDGSNCSCSTTGLGFYQVACPNIGRRLIEVELTDGKSLQIYCHLKNADIFSILPTLSFPGSGDTVESVIFQQCLPPATPFRNIIDRFGFSKVLNVTFDSRGENVSHRIEAYHFKGLHFVTGLDLFGSGNMDLAEDAFDDLTNLTLLNLKFDRIRFSPRVFRSTSRLNLLDMGENNLSSLPLGLFQQLGSLKLLNLWQNSLSSLPNEVFQGLNALEELDLSSNRLETLPVRVFQSMPNLKLLNLYANNLNSLPENLFAKNVQLKILNLFNNKRELKDLPKGLLSNLPHLEIVKLNRCMISILQESLFWNSTDLRSILLKENSLTILQKHLFKDQVNLKLLDLSNNEIMSIPDEALRSLMKLEIFNLNHNRLTKISGKIFEFLSSLKVLRIQDNHLKEIDSSAFSFSKNTVFIDLSYNMLAMMEDNINDGFSQFNLLNNLRYLNLSHNYITKMFPGWRYEHSNLTDLDLSYNRISRITLVDVSCLSEGIKVDLRNNNISTIDFNTMNQETPKLRSVKMLIDKNPIDCDCVSYEFVRFLRGKLNDRVKNGLIVDCGTATCASPEKMEGRLLSDLKEDEMLCLLDKPLRNHKKMCPTNCTCFVRVSDRSVIVNCSGSYSLSTINLPYAKENNFDCIEVHFEKNHLMDLSIFSSNISTFNRITKLFVKGNNISRLSNEDIPTNIEYLDLRNNLLRDINSSLADILNNTMSLKQVWFSGNPLDCDCDNLPFLSFLQTNYVKVKDFANITCSDGQLVSLLALGKICGPSPVIVAVSTIMVVISVILGILAALFYKYEREIKVWLFAKRLCLCCISEKELDKDKVYDVFISYSHKDEEFVVDNLVRELEKEPHPFKICLHFRDWVAGVWIPTQIVKSVEDSRRTLIVLSPDFLESVWGRMEFRVAHNRALKEGRARVVVILYGDIGSVETLDVDLQAYLSMNTYVKWGDPWFWDKLRYALPHSRNKNKLSPHSGYHQQQTYCAHNAAVIS